MLVKVGASYGFLVFGVGFLLGAIRVLLIAPATGAALAVAIETPFMLIASWLVWRALATIAHVPAEASSRLIAGGVGFVVLMGCELALGSLMFGRTPADFARDLGTPSGVVGLAAQICFALIPLAHAYRPGRGVSAAP